MHRIPCKIITLNDKNENKCFGPCQYTSATPSVEKTPVKTPVLTTRKV